MRRNAVEGILHLNTGVGGAGDDLVAVLRVPCQGGVQLTPQAVPRHEGLGCAALLAGAAVERHGAGNTGLFQIGLYPQRSRQRTGAQQIVTAAMAAAAGDKLLLRQTACFLGQAGQGVIFRQNTDVGPPAAKAGGKGSGNTAHVFFNLKALLLQHPAVQGGGLHLL